MLTKQSITKKAHSNESQIVNTTPLIKKKCPKSMEERKEVILISAIDAPPGTLSATSAATGRVYESISARKKAGEIREATRTPETPQGKEPAPAKKAVVVEETPKPVSAEKRITPLAEEEKRIKEREEAFAKPAVRQLGTQTREQTIRTGLGVGGLERAAGKITPVSPRLRKKLEKLKKEDIYLTDQYDGSKRKFIPVRKMGGISGTDIISDLDAKKILQTKEIKELQEVPVEKLSFQQKLSKQAEIYEQKASRARIKGESGFGYEIRASALGIGAGVIEVGKFLKDLATHPIRTGIQMIGGVKQAVTKPYQTFGAFGEKLRTRTSFTVGKLGGEVLATSGLFWGVSKVATGAKKLYVKAGAKPVAPEKIFDPKVLAGEKQFPTTKSVPESLARFKKTKTETGLKVAHTTPYKFAKETKIGSGISARKGMQDPGLYVTPAQEASPHFLQVPLKAAEKEYKFALFPKGFTKRPSVVHIDVKKVVRQPEKVLRVPGYKASAKYLEKQVGKGKAFITKRSELYFRPELDKGKGRPGTYEIEAVIPETTMLKVKKEGGIIARAKGYRYYTKVGDEYIPIKEYKVELGKLSKKKFVKVKTGIEKASKDYSSYLRKGKVKEVYPPYSLLYKKSIYPKAISYAKKPVYAKKPLISYPAKPSYAKKPVVMYSKKVVYPGEPSYPAKPVYPGKPVYPAKYPGYPYPKTFLSLPPVVPFLKLPKFKSRGEIKTKEYAPRLKALYKYQPSLEAVGEGIFETKKKKKKFDLLTGLELRPIRKGSRKKYNLVI